MKRWVVKFGEDKCDVYVGRPSKWGNPIRLGIEGNRKEVLEMYEAYLYSRPDLITAARRELRGKVLGCHCSPMLCHADVLARIANGWQLPPLEVIDE